MRVPIRNKLIFTYLLISIFTAFLIYLLTYFTSELRIKTLAQDYQLKEMSQEVSHWYAAEQQWQGFADYFKSLHPPEPKKQQNQQAVQNNNGEEHHGIVTSEYRALLRYKHYQAGDLIPKAYLSKAIPIDYQNKTIAWIIPPEVKGITLNSQVQVFLDNIQEVLIIAICIGVFISFLMGLILAKILLKPIELLTKASTEIASGKLQQQVEIYTDDEIGDLLYSFNKMSQDLVNADQQRRQITTDISHDLGTPVQVLSGYIEMAQEGTLPLNEDRINTIANELKHIKRLLKDFSLLAETDARSLSLELCATKIAPLLQRVKLLYQGQCQQKHIQLTVQCPQDLPELQLDEERIVQVLSNLISNAMRYTPPEGQITLQCKRYSDRLYISVNDNGSGIQAQDLPLIFNRLYRADNTRRGKSGKMGLGLAISQGLVEMQGGKIVAESDGENGSRFIISFPVT